jgi:hypothetical protein
MVFAHHPPSRTEPGVSARVGPFPRGSGFRYAWVAEAMSTDTPGPMVEDTETFFR